MACIAALLCGTAAQLQGAALVKMPRARDSEWWLARGRLKPTTTKAPSSPAQPADPRVVDAAPRVLLQKLLSGVHILTKTRGGEHFLREWLDFHFALGIGKVWLYEDGASAAMDQIARSYGDRVLHISRKNIKRGALSALLPTCSRTGPCVVLRGPNVLNGFFTPIPMSSSISEAGRRYSASWSSSIRRELAQSAFNASTLAPQA